MREYKGQVEVDLDTWKKHADKDNLVFLVESAAYQVMLEARGKGIVGNIRDVKMNIIPDFSEDKTHETVEVVIYYAPVL